MNECGSSDVNALIAKYSAKRDRFSWFSTSVTGELEYLHTSTRVSTPTLL